MSDTYVLCRTDGMPREAWLEQRRKGIGGSDAAGLVGMSDYATPWSVWADKNGLLPDKEDTEPIRIGRDLEDYVARRFAEASGLKVQHANAIYGNRKYPHSLANIDRRIMGAGLRAGLECKTTSAWNVKHYADGSFPERFYVQCVHYMAIMEAARWYLAVLVLGEGFHVYQMTRLYCDDVPSWCEGSVHVPQDEIDALMGAETAFWEAHVQTGTPPPVDGEKATMAAVEAVAGNGEQDTAVTLGCELSVRNYVELDAQIKALEKEKQKHRQAILLELGGAQKGVCPGWVVSNLPSTRRTFDHKAFMSDNADLDYSEYYIETTSTRFSIKEEKNENKV